MIILKQNSDDPHEMDIDDPYEMDMDDSYEMDIYVLKNNEKIPALSEKNIKFTKGILNYDSNYKKESDKNAGPYSENIFSSDFEVKENKYTGSIAYWFTKMNEGENFSQCLRGAIVAIDRSNSTHLSASKNGRSTIFNIIYSNYQNVVTLKKELGKFSKGKTIGKDHLIAKMSINIASTKGNQKRSNLSFASKFCAYADLYLNGNKNRYSKYDNVVSNHLKPYIDVFLDGKLDNKDKKKIRKKDIHYSSLDKKTSNNATDYILGIYNTYSKCIGKIISKVNGDNPNLNLDRDSFDRIVWYGFKGK